MVTCVGSVNVVLADTLCVDMLLYALYGSMAIAYNGGAELVFYSHCYLPPIVCYHSWNILQCQVLLCSTCDSFCYWLMLY